MVPLSMTLSVLWPEFQGHDILWSRISEERQYIKNKITIAQEEKYVTYGMVLCLMTLTDL